MIDEAIHGVFRLDEEAVDWVERTSASLTTEEKVGQLLMSICLNGSEEAISGVLSIAAGGVYRPAGLPTDELVSSTNTLNRESKTPLLISTDLEYGSFGYLKDGTDQQVQLGIAATGDPRHARRMGRIVGRELEAVGYNWVLSPVVDVLHNVRNAIISTRSFGDDPSVILEMAGEYVRGVEESKVVTCLKHWPGDGVDARDQHMATTENTLDESAWDEMFGSTYRSLITQGVRTIMTAHIALTHRDGHLPGTLSRDLNEELLRNELAFGGVIVSDATGMAGFGDCGPRDKTLPDAVMAGCDMIIANDAERDLQTLLTALDRGDLTVERVETAVTRVLALKASLGLHQNREPLRTASVAISMATPEHRSWSREAAEKSVTLVRNEQGVVPLDRELVHRVLVIRSEPVSTFFGRPVPCAFEDELRNNGLDVTSFASFADTPPEEFDLLVYLLDEREYFGMGTYHPSWARLHGGMIESLKRFWHDVHCVVVSFHNPFHLYDIPAAPTYINSYSSSDPIQRATARVLLGKIPAVGRSPVDLDRVNAI